MLDPSTSHQAHWCVHPCIKAFALAAVPLFSLFRWRHGFFPSSVLKVFGFFLSISPDGLPPPHHHSPLAPLSLSLFSVLIIIWNYPVHSLTCPPCHVLYHSLLHPCHLEYRQEMMNKYLFNGYGKRHMIHLRPHNSLAEKQRTEKWLLSNHLGPLEKLGSCRN